MQKCKTARILGIVRVSKTGFSGWRTCSGGGTGRRVWLRSIWSNPWGFKSPLEYHHYEWRAYIAQSVEHILGKDEVSGSSPDVGSIFNVGLIRLEFVITQQIIKIWRKENG